MKTPRMATQPTSLLILLLALWSALAAQATRPDRVGPPHLARLTTNQKEANTNRLRRSHERDFAPKLIHQPHSVSAESGKPQTIECPVEAQPESEIRWFKDGQLLQSDQPAHLEQTGSELMFFQINEFDSGDYHCQAANYLGSATSDRFRLQVQSTIRDPRIRIEPRRLELVVTPRSQWAEFTCILPAPSSSSSGAYSAGQISWRRNGKRIEAFWPRNSASSSSSLSSSATQAKYLAEQTSGNEFKLRIRGISQHLDNSSTFSCVFEGDQSELGDWKQSQQQPDSKLESSQLARESLSDSLLLILTEAGETSAPAEDNNSRPIHIDVNMGPPLEQLNNPTTTITTHNTTGNSSTLLEDTSSSDKPKRRLVSLDETLRDLYEIAKPTLIVFGIMCLVLLLVLLNIFFIWRRPCASSTSRYMKHQQQQHHFLAGAGGQTGSACSSNVASSCSSASSGTGMAGLMAECGDPMLSSLLGRTLSAGAAPLVSGTGNKNNNSNNNKFKQYRSGQMRKVCQAAQLANNEFNQASDFLDVANYFSADASLPAMQTPGNNFYQHPPPPPPPQMPNLYNQSLAAREQARSLLQASEHMRSLSNLMQAPNNNNNNNNKDLQRGVNGSHLNLPLSFSFDRQQAQPLDANQLLNHQINSNMWQQQQPGRQLNENYQLVSCSSISPNSSSNGSDHHRPQQQQQQQQSSRIVTLSSNHYLTIDDAHCDEEQRYEELDGQRNQPQRSSISSSHSRQQQQQQSSFRSNNSIKKALLNGTVNHSMKRLNASGSGQQQISSDQLSPYAVSSICSNNNGAKYSSQPPLPPPPPPPPPVTPSEAMRALNEQFDINQLMSLADDEQDSKAGGKNGPPQSDEHLLSCLPFNPPPPPPPPPVPNSDPSQDTPILDRSQQRRKISGNRKRDR